MIEKTFPSKNRLIRLALAGSSGILLLLSFPKFGSGLLAWFALTPLLFSLRTANPAEGFRLGFFSGLVAHVGILYWIVHVVVQYGDLPLSAGLLAMLLLCSYLSVYTAVFAMGVVWFHSRGVRPFFSAPPLWTVLEFFRSHLLTGFPWENLAYSQYLHGNLIQLADWTGIYGITFAIVLANALWADCFAERDRKRLLLTEGLAVIALIAAMVGYGHFRILDLENDLRGAAGFPVTLVQGNIDQSVKWDPRYQEETLEIYRFLTLREKAGEGGLIVWPETAAPFYFQQLGPLRERVVSVARTAGGELLFGSPSYEKANGRIGYRNSAFLLGPDGVPSGRYDKVHLVPYGEYVPLRTIFPFIGKLVAGVGDFQAGEGFHPLVGEGQKLGVLICYEGIFPEAARAYKRGGATLLVNITNDAWFGRTSAPYQHLSMTVFRAVETRLHLVRAANTGISAIIDPTGRILSRTHIFERTVLKGEVKIIDEKTFYAAYGDWFVGLCGMVLLILSISACPRQRRKKDVRRNS
jgi:apolipoprotein N-acyltransferase